MFRKGSHLLCVEAELVGEFKDGGLQGFFQGLLLGFHELVKGSDEGGVHVAVPDCLALDPGVFCSVFRKVQKTDFEVEFWVGLVDVYALDSHTLGL